MEHEQEILAPPSDGVTCMRFSTSGTRSHLVVSSWDSILRVYEGIKLRSKVDMEQPLLSCTFGHTEQEVFTGGLHGECTQVDVTTRQKKILGQHTAAVRHVAYSREYGVVVSGGWDGMIKVWDVRNGKGACINQASLRGKVFGMDVNAHLLVVSTSERQNYVYDLRSFHQPLLEKESPLKYQTRCVRVFSDLKGYAMGSIEGRVALEYLQEDYSVHTERSYAFKCHREKREGETFIYPVNTIAFHPILKTFATGGGDGNVYIWDGDHKKRIAHLRQYPTSIASLEFNHDGTILAIAASYTFEEGEKE